MELRHERVVEVQMRRREQNEPAFEELQKSGLLCIVEGRTAVDVVVRPHEIPRFHRVSTPHRGKEGSTRRHTPVSPFPLSRSSRTRSFRPLEGRKSRYFGS